MDKNTRTRRDPFAFSLAGINVVNGFSISAVIADDLIRTSKQEEFAEPSQDQPDTAKELTSFWKRFRRARKAA